MESKVIPRSQGIRHLVERAGLGNTRLEWVERPPEAVIAECLRATFSALCFPQGVLGVEPVYVTRVTNRVREQLSPVWPTLMKVRNRRPSEANNEDDVDPIHHVLHLISDLGDAVELKGGYWLPGPLRLVQLPIGDVLAIGGVDTRTFSRLLDIQVHSQTLARIVDTNMAGRLSKLDLWQPYQEWIGEIPTDLEEWMQGYLAAASVRLQESGTEVTDVDVYRPEGKASQAQAFRWEALRRIPHPPAGLALCRSRPKRGRWAVSYWLGTFRDSPGGTVLDREAEVGLQDVRRLQYGFDRMHRAPSKIRVEQDGPNYLLTVQNWLPSQERKLLLALTQDASSSPGRLPARYRVPQARADELFQHVQRLGIRLDHR